MLAVYLTDRIWRNDGVCGICDILFLELDTNAFRLCVENDHRNFCKSWLIVLVAMAVSAFFDCYVSRYVSHLVFDDCCVNHFRKHVSCRVENVTVFPLHLLVVMAIENFLLRAF